MKRVNQKGKGKTMMTAWMLSLLMAVSPCMSAQANAEETVAAEAVEVSSRALEQEVTEEAEQEIAEASAEEAEQEIAEASAEEAEQEIAEASAEEAEQEAVGNPRDDGEDVANRCTFFDPNTGTLTLSGELTMDAVQAYAYNNSVRKIVATQGTKFPVYCSALFKDFHEVESIDLSKADTTGIYYTSYMFENCYKLKELDISSFDTSNVYYMQFMFANCYELESLDLSHFDTSNVSSMQQMFFDCYKLQSVDVSGFDTSNVRNMEGMFEVCPVLKKVDVSNFNISKVENMKEMFALSAFTELDLSSFDTSNVTNMYGMFMRCDQLKKISVSNLWNTNAVTDSKNMFERCTSLVGQNGTAFSADHIDASYARVDGRFPGYFTYRANAAITRQPENATCEMLGGTILFNVDVTGAEGFEWHVTDRRGNDYTWEYIQEQGWATLREGTDKMSILILDKVYPGLEGKKIYCVVRGRGGYSATTRYCSVTVEKKVKYVYAEVKNLDQAVAGANVKDFTEVTFTDAYGNACPYLTGTVNWYLFNKLMTDCELALNEEWGLRFEVNATNGYGFTSDRVCYVYNFQGHTQTATRVTGTETETYSVFTVSPFKVQAPEGGILISEIIRTIKEPVAGEEPAWELDPLSRGEERKRHYTVERLEWYNDPGAQMMKGDKFEAGKDYFFLVVYRADSEYAIDSDGSFLLNGQEMKVFDYLPGKKGAILVGYYFSIPAENGVVWSASVNFSGMIGLNYYCEIPDGLSDDEGAYVTLTMEDETPVTILVKDAKTKNLYGHETKLFSYPVVAKKMRENVVLRLFNGNGEEIALKSGSGVDYGMNGCPMSVVSYCDLIEQNSTDEKTLALAKAVKDYGTASQIYFNYKPEGLVLDSRVTDFNKDFVVDNFMYSITGVKPDGFAGYQSISLVLEAENTLRVYHGYDKGVGAGRFAYTVDGVSKKIIKTNKGKCYLEVANIAAKDLDTVHTFTVSLGGKTQTLKASALSYAALLCKGDNEVQNNLGKALYLYNVAAKEYFKK